MCFFFLKSFSLVLWSSLTFVRWHHHLFLFIYLISLSAQQKRLAVQFCLFGCIMFHYLKIEISISVPVSGWNIAIRNYEVYRCLWICPTSINNWNAKLGVGVEKFLTKLCTKPNTSTSWWYLLLLSRAI
jgi:hypothetical protein